MFSGAMDILVIESPNDVFKSSAFHVRFGSLKVIKSKEQDIEIYVNSKKKNVTMKLSSSGDAYFQYDELDPYMIKQQNIYSDNILRGKNEKGDNDKEVDNLNKNNINESKQIDNKKENKIGKEELKQKDYNLFKKKYKSFFPSSHQLKELELKQGRNEICFICKTSSSGVQTLKSSIYLWPSTSKIVISDIDGTITRSDVLGQVLPFLGRDWTHEGVIDLFTEITKRGYKIVYLTARAIGQSTMTKNYLDSLIQEKKALPEGPLFMSPDGLFTSFKREVIERKPHLLKIPLLTELKNLFPDGTKPFFAGFGNRETDGVAYRYLDVPLNNIFIIDIKSNVLRLGDTKKTSYKVLSTNLDGIFPHCENNENEEKINNI
jgi:phosphatidate phosphatase LPIN